jgi:hypothetical protein
VIIQGASIEDFLEKVRQIVREEMKQEKEVLGHLPKWLSSHHLTELYGVKSTRTIMNRMKAGKIPQGKYKGRAWIWRREDIEDDLKKKDML